MFRTTRELVYFLIAIVLFIALVGMVTLEIWNIPLFHIQSVDYEALNSWGTTISAIATALAVIVSLASWHWQRSSQFATEEKRLTDAETSIFQYLVVSDVKDAIDDTFLGRAWYLYIQNTTPAPIYYWLVSFNLQYPHLCSALERPLLPGENRFRLYDLDNIEPSQAPRATLTFQGNSGSFWLRSPEGSIRKVNKLELKCEHSST